MEKPAGSRLKTGNRSAPTMLFPVQICERPYTTCSMENTLNPSMKYCFERQRYFTHRSFLNPLPYSHYVQDPGRFSAKVALHYDRVIRLSFLQQA